MLTRVETPSTQVALLHRISYIVSSDQDIEAILKEMVTLTRSVTQSDACLLYLTDLPTEEIVLRASQLPHDAEIGAIRIKMGEGITGWVAANRAVVALSSNAWADMRFKPIRSLQEDTYQAFLSVPLVDGGQTIGVINVHHRDPHRHSDDEIALVSFIGEQMGGLIARARLAEQSLNALHRMNRLAAVAQVISTGSYLLRILQTISEMAGDTLNSPVCSIVLIDEEKKEMTVSAARCSAPDYMHRMPIRMEGSLVEYVIRQNRPVIVPNIHSEKQYRYPELARKSGLTSLLAAPLASQGKVIGSINVYTQDKHTFSDDEIGFIQVVAGQAAAAIQNARLISETLEIKRTLEARKLIERAKGIIQYKYNITEEEAYLRLRNKSSRLRRSMRELAEAVIMADVLSRKEGVVTTRADAMSDDDGVM